MRRKQKQLHTETWEGLSGKLKHHPRFLIAFLYFLPMAKFGSDILHEAVCNSVSPYSLPFFEHLLKPISHSTVVSLSVFINSLTCYVSWLISHGICIHIL